MAKEFQNILADKKEALSFNRQIRNYFEKKSLCGTMATTAILPKGRTAYSRGRSRQANKKKCDSIQRR
jgi:hypothetical protein